MINKKHALNLSDYHQLYLFSTTRIHLFWLNVFSHDPIPLADPSPSLRNCLNSGATDDIKHAVVDKDASPDQNPRWFPGTRINWAENMLTRHRYSNNTALIQARQ